MNLNDCFVMRSNFVKDIVKEIIESYNIAGDYDFMLKILVKRHG
jgi:hypothetical protein